MFAIQWQAAVVDGFAATLQRIKLPVAIAYAELHYIYIYIDIDTDIV